jgi:hypothetical protein
MAKDGMGAAMGRLGVNIASEISRGKAMDHVLRANDDLANAYRRAKHERDIESEKRRLSEQALNQLEKELGGDAAYAVVALRQLRALRNELLDGYDPSELSLTERRGKNLQLIALSEALLLGKDSLHTHLEELADKIEALIKSPVKDDDEINRISKKIRRLSEASDFSKVGDYVKPRAIEFVKAKVFLDNEDPLPDMQKLGECSLVDADRLLTVMQKFELTV